MGRGRTLSLLSVDAVQRVREEEEDGDEEPDEAGDGSVIRLGQAAGLVVVIIDGGEGVVAHAADEADQREQVGRHPPGAQLDDSRE